MDFKIESKNYGRKLEKNIYILLFKIEYTDVC